MSFSTNSVDYTRISRYVRIPARDNNMHNRREAALYISLGYRVVDEYGFDITVEDRADGTRRLVRGEDLLGSFNDGQRLQTLARRQRADASGRPLGLPKRELTDYEAGREHDPDRCNISNCDHPVHFGGDRFGKLTFDSPSETKEDNKYGCDGPAGVDESCMKK